MRILSWNVNGLRSVARKGAIQSILDSKLYDAILLQEVKTEKIDDELGKKGYAVYLMHSKDKKGYSGVATLYRDKPIKTIYGIDDEKFDKEGRVITLEFENYFLINSYFPNSRRDLSRLSYKIEFNRRILEFMEKLRKIKPIIIGGDFNVAHTALDIARSGENEGNAGFTGEEREFIDLMIEKGYIDTFRMFSKDKGNYTWWTYLYKSARENNIDFYINRHMI